MRNYFIYNVFARVLNIICGLWYLPNKYFFNGVLILMQIAQYLSSVDYHLWKQDVADKILACFYDISLTSLLKQIKWVCMFAHMFFHRPESH